MTSAATTNRELFVPIGGMTCAACTGHVQRALDKTPGVHSARVSLDERAARVSIDASTTPEAIVAAIERAGYDADLIDEVDDIAAERETQTRLATELSHAKRDVTVLMLGFGIVMATSMYAMAMHRLDWMWATAVISSVVVVAFGRETFVRAWAATRNGHANMSTLVALGTSAAMGWSLAVLVNSGHAGIHHVYFESAVGVLAFVSLGHWFETRARMLSRKGVLELTTLIPATACIVRGDGRVELSARDVRKGDTLIIRPFEHVVADCTVLEGESEFDVSHLSGEPLPVAKRKGDTIAAGSKNGARELTARVDAMGKNSTVASLFRLIREAHAGKTALEALADRVSRVFVPAVLLLAAATFVVWWLWWGDVTRAVEHALAVLVVSCPCAMGLAVPAAVAAATATAARRGILIKEAATLERAAQVRAIVFDKTGTLTVGRPRVVDVAHSPTVARMQVLGLAAALEQHSEHVFARAIIDAAGDAAMPRCTNVEVHLGNGITAEVEGVAVRLGTRSFVLSTCKDASWHTDATSAHSEVYVAQNGILVAVIALDDTVRDDAAAVVQTLKTRGFALHLLSGDPSPRTAALAQSLGIADAEAGASPKRKADVVKAIAATTTVAMIGDGQNDAPALAAASLGIAMASSSDGRALQNQPAPGVTGELVARAADVVILRGGLGSVLVLLTTAQAAVRIMRQNLFWAFAYNVVTIPLAAGALTSWGLKLNPTWAGALMAVSSISVVLNSLRLLRQAPA